MSATLERPRLPAEYRGRARAFRDEVRRTDVQMEKALATITVPLRARLKRHPRLRHEMIAGAVRLYKLTVPTRFRLSEIEVDPDRAAFAIAETRMTITWLSDEAWGDAEAHELGIGICRYTMWLENGKLREQWIGQVIVSAHAIARWFERTGLRDHDALTTDIALLADADPECEKVETTTGCYWLGGLRPMRGLRQHGMVRSVRTLVIE